MREQFTFFLAIYFILSDLMFSFILEACYNFTVKSVSVLNGGVLKKCRKPLKASLFVALSLFPEAGAWEVDGEAAPPVGLLSYGFQIGSSCLPWQFQFCAMISCILTIQGH